jgi:hypothetical protein
VFFGRGKNKIQDPYTMPDMYKDYLNKIDKNTPYDISYSLYRDIVSLYNKKIYDKLLEGFNVILPYKLGSVQIIKKRMYFKTQQNKKLGIDWENTNKYGKLIHHLNEHSDGYKFLFFWDRYKKMSTPNSKYYKLIPTRTLKRELASIIKKDKKDYFEI